MITGADQWDTTRWYNFAAKEFVCTHCNALKISPIALDFLQSYRTFTGKSVVITSAYRCPEHNNKVSSTGLAGPHTTGKAVDIHVSHSAHRKQLIDYFTNKVTGLGIAKTFIHIDIITPDELSHRPNCWLY